MSELVNETVKLRGLADYLHKQSRDWANMSNEMLADLQLLGRTWKDDQFRDMEKSVGKLRITLHEFQDDADFWGQRLRSKADNIERKYRAI
jgi:hypothetical protein